MSRFTTNLAVAFAALALTITTIHAATYVPATQTVAVVTFAVA